MGDYCYWGKNVFLIIFCIGTLKKCSDKYFTKIKRSLQKTNVGLLCIFTFEKVGEGGGKWDRGVDSGHQGVFFTGGVGGLNMWGRIFF